MTRLEEENAELRRQNEFLNKKISEVAEIIKAYSIIPIDESNNLSELPLLKNK